MVEAVVPALNSSGELRDYYEKIKSRKGSKVAKVATARRLLCIVYRVLKEKDSFKVHKKEVRNKYSGAAFKKYSAVKDWHSTRG